MNPITLERIYNTESLDARCDYLVLSHHGWLVMKVVGYAFEQTGVDWVNAKKVEVRKAQEIYLLPSPVQS